jgi:Fe-S cluster biogenesis protein NfuA
MRMTPGRIAALAIGAPFALALICYSGFGLVTLVGQGSFPVAYTIPVGAGGVSAQINSGALTLRQGGVGTAQLTGTATYSLFRPSVSLSEIGTQSVVSFDCHSSTGNCELNATLVVPRQAPVSLSTDGGDLAVSGFTGDLTVNTDGGNVNAGDLAGGVIEFGTAGGDVTVNELTADNPQVNTDGGNVTIDAVNAADGLYQTGGGDITLTFTQVPKNLRIESDGGDINLVLPATDTRYDISANSDGGNLNVANSILTGGDARNSLTLDSGGGDINVT